MIMHYSCICTFHFLLFGISVVWCFSVSLSLSLSLSLSWIVCAWHLSANLLHPSVIIQKFYSNIQSFDYSFPCFITSVQGTHIVVTLELISKVLHVLRVSHLDYPRCPRLRTVSKDGLLSLFCETPSS